MSDRQFPVIRSTLLAQFPNIVAGMSTRQGAAADAPFGFNLGFQIGDDDARVEAHLARFAEALGLGPDDIAFMDQVHEDRIVTATEAGIHPACDAIITREPLLGLAVRVADCIPILLYAPGDGVVAAVHAGWKGTAEHLAAKTVAALASEHGVDPGGVYAWIGPGAGPCCYAVSPDVAGLFPASAVRERPGANPHVDLPAANRAQLLDAGVPAENIEVEGRCTICDSALFHSHRRDGARAGRMLAIIAILREADV